MCFGGASFEVQLVYKQFVGAVVELIDGELVLEEFHEADDDKSKNIIFSEIETRREILLQFLT